MASVLKAYAASSNLTVTNLHSLPTSADWTFGWESALIDNSSNKYLDYRITAKIIVGSTLTAGEIRMYLVGMINDSTWPDIFDGTESTESLTDTEIRDAICLLAAVSVTDTTNGQDYYLDCPSAAAVFGGNLPEKFVVFITQNTNANLGAAGSVVSIKGSYETVA